jgi:DNA-binding CsgD family transcriptional regulator
MTISESHHFCGYAVNTVNNSYYSSLKHQKGYIGQPPALRAGADSELLLAHTLDELACGVIIVNELGQVQHCNLAGKVILQRGQWLRQEGSRIHTLNAKDQAGLLEALSRATQGKRGMLALGDDAQSTVAIVPLDRHLQTAAGEPESSGSRRIALIFSRSGMCESLMMSFFARAYQLTRSEEQILSLICVGHTALEMAKHLSVGEATVRTHIRSICQKTHSHGIREVVKRLALLPPLMAAVMPSAFA